MAIDGKHYTSYNVQVSMAGKVVTTAKRVKYKVSADTEEIHVLGDPDPYATVRKQNKYEGEIELLTDEINALHNSIESGLPLTNIAPFDLIVMRIGANDELITDVLEQVRIKEAEYEMEADELFESVTLPLSVGRIRFNI